MNFLPSFPYLIAPIICGEELRNVLYDDPSYAALITPTELLLLPRCIDRMNEWVGRPSESAGGQAARGIPGINPILVVLLRKTR